MLEARRYSGDVEKRERPTEAVQKAFEAKMKAAGITVVTPRPGTGTITFLKRREPEKGDYEK